MKFTKYDIQKLENYWINLEHYKKELRHRERDLLEGWVESDMNIGGGKSNRISDTTGNKAVILADDALYQTLKRIVHTIETMYDELDEEQKIIVDMRYRSDKDGYQWDHIGEALNNMSVQRVLRKRNHLLDETARRMGYA